MAVARINDSASVLVIADSRETAAPVMEYFSSQELACGFAAPDNLGYQGQRIFGLYRTAVVLDIDGDARLCRTAALIASRMPCALVSDRADAVVPGVGVVLHTDTSPVQLLAALRPLLGAAPTIHSLVGDSPPILALKHAVQCVAPTRATVLIQGETGSGKGLVAREIHRRSGRRGAFVSVNCAALAAMSHGDALFDPVSAVSPGAADADSGFLARAEGGTLFLDNIEALSDAFQARTLDVLDVLDARQFDVRERRKPADVRVVAATQSNARALVREGVLRADLFHRLAVFPVGMPPLRQRLQDMAILVEVLSCRLAQLPAHLDATAFAELRRHDWPGNVRELENLLERLSILHPDETVSGDIIAQQLQAKRPASEYAASENSGAWLEEVSLSDDGLDLRAAGEMLERRLIEQALSRSDGVVAQAARLLALRRTTLIEKMRRYGIE